MALDFPSSPINGQEFPGSNGITYVYDATAGLWYVKTSESIGVNFLADNAVTTPKIADGAVTEEKISLVGGSVVGYQEGFWAPSVMVQGSDIANGNSGIWAWEGVPNSNSGPGGASPFIDAAQFEHTWHRIGNQVTLTAWVRFTVPGGNLTGKLVWERLPYPLRQPLNNQTYYARSGDAVLQNVPYPANMVNSAPYIWTGPSGSDDRVGIRFSSNLGQSGAELVGGDIIENSTISYTITYQTDDTTWTPNNGATLD